MNSMSIQTVNGCIYIGTSLGNIFHIAYLTYSMSVFCIISIYILLNSKHKIVTYLYSVMMIIYYGMSLYYMNP